jgi:DNA-binding XRE family transcriptional regulator
MTARRQHLAERRRSLGYSQERLASQVGVDRTTVGRWERGETGPQPLIRERLRTVLKVSAEELDTLIPVGPEDEHLLSTSPPAGPPKSTSTSATPSLPTSPTGPTSHTGSSRPTPTSSSTSNETLPIPPRAKDQQWVTERPDM